VLEAISKKLCSELCDKGINAFTAYPVGDIPRDEPVVAVSLKKAQVSSGGFGDYMGLDSMGEVYGLMCSAQFELGIYTDADEGYSRMSGECDRLIAAVWDLSGGIGSVSFGQCEYDKNLNCLYCCGVLGAGFWLTRGGEDADEIHEFTVKGMILHGNQ